MRFDEVPGVGHAHHRELFSGEELALHCADGDGNVRDFPVIFRPLRDEEHVSRVPVEASDGDGTVVDKLQSFVREVDPRVRV